jgi:acetyl-CoA synthetase
VTGQIGELVLYEPFVGMTQSFWQDRERYLETYWSRYPGVWAHGDLARKDPDGQYFLLGRSDDTLKLAGKRVGPAEVEETILASEFVTEAAAVGLPDSLKGQKLVVFVVRTPAKDDVADGEVTRLIGQLLEERMGRPFRPDAVHVVEELPKNRSRKVMRRLIRDVCMGTPTGDTTSLENPGSLDGIRRARADV